MKALVVDSDQLLKFSESKNEAVNPEATFRPGEEGTSQRSNSRGSASSQGVALPDLLPGMSATFSPSSPSMPKTALPVSKAGGSDLGLDIQTSSGPEQKAGPASRSATLNLGGGSDDKSPPLLKRQFTFAERIEQLLTATVQQPLSYVLLLGILGFFIVLKYRRL